MILKDLILAHKNNLTAELYFKKFSPYLYDLLSIHRDWLLENQEKSFDDLFISFTQILNISLHSIPAEELMTLMRIIKGRSSLVIALCDIFGNFNVSVITDMLSRVADLLIQSAFKAGCIEWINRNKLPIPLDRLQTGSGLIVVAMGKLGAMELNFSSDVDICVFFDPNAIENVDKDILYDGFVRATKSAVRILSQRTEHGYVYRVDLRLRPDPASTKVAVPIESAEYYYERSGQNWERAAWIKGRFVYGDPVSWAKFKEILRPFIWRRNLDFAAIQDIHSIKRQIHAHYGHDEIKVYGHDVKLGKGGIREIELFVQTQQLIGGGRDLRLRTQATLDMLKILVEKQWIKENIADKMANAYCLFRKVEHRLQMVHDAQTHTLPVAGDEFNLITEFCDFNTPQEFIDTMMHAMRDVNHAYKKLFENYQPLSSAKGSLVFSGIDYHPDTVEQLQKMGFSAPKTAIDIIANWHKGHYKAMRSAKAREILTELTPLLLEKISYSNNPDTALIRLDRFIGNLPTGIAFFSYLINSAELMDLLIDIMAFAPNLADYLAQYPSTFDVMTDVSFFIPPESESDFEQELLYRIRSNIPNDIYVHHIRKFNREQKFRISVLVLKNLMSTQQASIAFTNLARVCITHIAFATEKEIREKHNLPFEKNDRNSLCIVGMGSLGAYEMNADSDLDLLMIYNPDNHFNESIDTPTYYAKLGKRILSALTITTTEGALYDVDMQLRPSGNSGPLVIHYDRFVDYQRHEAHIWEHCALTRLTPICGDKNLQHDIINKKNGVIALTRDSKDVKNHIHEMRLKLLHNRPPKNIWDIKLSQGGLFDIGFIVQYLILSYAHTLPPIFMNNTRDNLRILNQHHLIDDKDFKILTQAFDMYHSLLHILAIAKIDITLMTLETISKKIIQRICDIMMIDNFSDAHTLLETTYQNINNIYHKIFEI
jgi:[glutamine synthetase] adenylyltransferase / [glutamine synthetase]-adenylyl-L-tyrosine phosphorylase